MGSEKVKKFSALELSLFCSQLSWILKAAVPLEEGIAAVCENTENSGRRKILKTMQAGIAAGGSLSRALNESGAFPDYLVSMVAIGEKAGKLDDVVLMLARHYEREDRLRGQIRNAVLYPLVLILMIAGVVAVLVVKVLPVFRQVFENLGADVPPASVAAMNVGAAVGRYAFFVILGIVLLALLCCALAKTRNGARLFRNLSEKIPFTRGIFEKIGAARFASVMSMLLASGYDASESLDLTAGVLGSPAMTRKAEACRRAMSGGAAFPQALKAAGLFSGIYAGMITVGEKTGSLDSVMNQLASHYSEEAGVSLSNAVSLIEPVLVGLLSAVIGAVLLSVMLPLMGIMSSVG